MAVEVGEGAIGAEELENGGFDGLAWPEVLVSALSRGWMNVSRLSVSREWDIFAKSGNVWRRVFHDQ